MHPVESSPSHVSLSHRLEEELSPPFVTDEEVSLPSETIDVTSLTQAFSSIAAQPVISQSLDQVSVEEAHVQERKRQIFAQFLEECGWHTPECYTYTLRQWIALQLQLLIKEVRDDARRKDEDKQTLVEKLMFLLVHTFEVKGQGCPLPKEFRGIVDEVTRSFPFPSPAAKWVPRIHRFLGDESFLKRSLSSILQRPMPSEQERFCSAVCVYGKVLKCCYEEVIGTGFAPMVRGCRTGEELIQTICSGLSTILGSLQEPAQKLEGASPKLSDSRRGVISDGLLVLQEKSKGYLTHFDRELQRLFKDTLRNNFSESIPSRAAQLSLHLQSSWSVMELLIAQIDKKMSMHVKEVCEGLTKRLLSIVRNLEAHPSKASFLGRQIPSLEGDGGLIAHWRKNYPIFLAAREDFESFCVSTERHEEVNPWDLADACGLSERALEIVDHCDDKKNKKRELGSSPPAIHEDESIPESRESGAKSIDVGEIVSPAYLDFLLSVVRSYSHSEWVRRPAKFISLHKTLIIDRTARLLAPVEGETVSHYQRKMREVFNHLHMEACGFELLGTLLEQQRLDLFPAVVPMWVADCCIQAERFGDVLFEIKENSPRTSHSLKDLSKKIGEWGSLPSHLKNYLDNISHGIFWYRYPVSQKRLYKDRSLPDALQWILRSHEMSAGEIAPFVACMTQGHACSYELLYRRLFQNDLDRVEAFMGPVHGQMEETRKRLGLAIERSVSEGMQCRRCGDNEEMRILFQLEQRCQILRKGGFPSSQDPEIQMHLEEISLKLSQMRKCIELAAMCPQPHFFAFHFRNLLNIQWIMEHIYSLEIKMLGCSEIHTHAFYEYESIVSGLQDGVVRPSYPHLFDYNTSIWAHAEESCQRRRPPFEMYMQLLKGSINAAAVDESSAPVEACMVHFSELFHEHAHTICRLLDASLGTLLQKLESEGLQ